MQYDIIKSFISAETRHKLRDSLTRNVWDKKFFKLQTLFSYLNLSCTLGVGLKSNNEILAYVTYLLGKKDCYRMFLMLAIF